jgi:hypothetical protein
MTAAGKAWTGKGRLARAIVQTVTTTGLAVTIRDGTTASGAVITVISIDPIETAETSRSIGIEIGANFNTGIYVSWAGTGSLTLIFEGK